MGTIEMQKTELARRKMLLAERARRDAEHDHYHQNTLIMWGMVIGFIVCTTTIRSTH